MSEQEKLDISEVLDRIEDASYSFRHIEKYTHERFDRIHEALKIIDEEYYKLWDLIKDK